MSDRSAIEWTDATWSPVRGCKPVSSGCRNCYAARMARRMDLPGGAYEGLTTRKGWTGEARPVPNLIHQPLRWRKPRRVFVCSMSDLFHEDVPDLFLRCIWQTMSEAKQHTFQILTKRIQRMRDFLSAGDVPILSNVWVGTTTENHEAADERIPILLETPAVLRFVSIEPMLGPVIISPWFRRVNIPSGEDPGCGVDWVICGCESGPKARYFDPSWARSIRDQCAHVGIPFMLKQIPVKGKLVKLPELDGKIHNAIPEVSR